MIGIILASLGTLFDEISLSFGKWQISHNKENIYTFGFLNYFWLMIIFIIMAIWKNSFVFSYESIPLLVVYIILEFAQSYSTLHAVKNADRSTSGFLMIITIPLLLIADTFLGYTIDLWSMVGIFVIVISLILLFINHGINKKGIGYVLFSAINAAVTISIYKYCITHYNSVEAQVIIPAFFLLIFLLVMSIWRHKENPLNYIFKKELFVQSIFMGAGSTFLSIAYVYAPASIITSAKRAFSILWSVVSGNKIFHEKHVVVKIICFGLMTVGLLLMVI